MTRNARKKRYTHGVKRNKTKITGAHRKWEVMYPKQPQDKGNS